MIVRLNGPSQLLITQPDHAALAVMVMQQWRAGGLLESPRLSSILLAVEEHDNGWREVDTAPLVDEVTGRVLDFVGAPDQIRRAVWPRGVDRLAGTPYAAALVAQHALHIYRRYRDNPAWTEFFTDMETRRDLHLERLPFDSPDRSARSGHHERGSDHPSRMVRPAPSANSRGAREWGWGPTSRKNDAGSPTLEELRREYFFLRIGDLVSLTFCNGWTEGQVDDSGSGCAMRFDGTRLTITPDPFEGRELPLEVVAHELPNRTFRSAAEAQDAFSRARTVLVKGVASGPLHISV